MDDHDDNVLEDRPVKRSAPTGFFIYSKREYEKYQKLGTTMTNDTKVEIGKQWKALPAEEKKKYIDEAELAKEKLAKLTGQLPPKPRKRKVQTRISLNQITEIVKKFTQEQRDAVRVIGLGGLLELKCKMLNHGLCKWLVNQYDPDSSSLTVHGRTFIVTESHVHECLGINAEGNCDGMRKEEGFSELCSDLGVLNGHIPLTKLRVYLLSEGAKEAGCEFKRKFALYMVGSFLCPTTKPAVNKSFVHLVSDVVALENLNWAKLTLQFLCQSIRDYRTNNRVQSNGCLFLLMVLYFDRVLPSTYVMPAVRTIPSLLFWGDVEIKDVLSHFERIGGYDKEGVAVVFTMEGERKEEEVKTCVKEGGSSQIPTPQIPAIDLATFIHLQTSFLSSLNTILERQTSLFERVLPGKGTCNPNEANPGEPGHMNYVHRNEEAHTPCDNFGKRTSTPDTFRTPEGQSLKCDQRGSKGSKDREFVETFSPQTYQGGYSLQRKSSNSSRKTKSNTSLEGGEDEIKTGRSPVSVYKSVTGLCRGRKGKFPNSNLRRCLRVSKVEGENDMPVLRGPEELKKSIPCRSPYTHDGLKKRNPPKKRGPTKPIVLDEEDLKMGNVDVKIASISDIMKKFKDDAYVVRPVIPETKSYVRELRDNLGNHSPLSLNAEEDLLKQFIFDPSHEFTSEPYVHIELFYRARDFATRQELCTLKPKQWIFDTIINLVAVQLTNQERAMHPNKRHKTWYFPVTLAFLVLKEKVLDDISVQKICNMFFGDDNFTSDLYECTSIYIPLNNNKSHWICLKVDMVKGITYIFDSKPSRQAKNSVQQRIIIRLMDAFQRMLRLQCGDINQDVRKFPIANWERQPLQDDTDGYDCGLFVIKFMQGFEYPPGLCRMDDLERPRLLMQLVNDVNNREVLAVLDKFHEWKVAKGICARS